MAREKAKTVTVETDTKSSSSETDACQNHMKHCKNIEQNNIN